MISMQTNYVDNYLKRDSKEAFQRFMLQTPFFPWCLEHSNQLDEPLIDMMAKMLNLLGDRAFHYEQKLLKKLPDSAQVSYVKSKARNEQADIKYAVLVQVGYTINKTEDVETSPIQHAKELQRDYQMNQRGFFYDDKEKLQLEPNTFVRYLCKRIALVQTLDGEIFRYADGKYQSLNKNVVRKLARDIVNEVTSTLWKPRFERLYMVGLEHEIPFIEDFDTNPDIVNFSNGLLNIKTLELAKHTPNYHSINQLAYEYDPDAKCPKFERFLYEIFEGDQERVALIRQILGYIWLKEVKIHKAFIFLGTGSNGKSVLAKIMHALYGAINVASTPLSAMEGRFGLQEFPGRLVSISSENEYGKELDTENIKQATSGDAMMVEQKYRDAFTTRLYVKLVVLLNKLMDSADTSNGFLRRLLIVPFPVKFEELKQGEERKSGVKYMDLNLENELLEELPGIFNFAMEGLHDLINNDFQLVSSEACEAALEEYKRNQNPVVAFVEECMTYEKGARVLRSDITRAYNEWYKRNGDGAYRKLSSQRILPNFRNEIARLGWNTYEPKIEGLYYCQDMKFKSLSDTDSSLDEGYVTSTQ